LAMHRRLRPWRAPQVFAAVLLAGTLLIAPTAGAAATAGVRLGAPSAGPGAQRGYLDGVAALSARDAWAVGTSDPAFQTLIDHWNGSAWKRVPSPDPADSDNSGFLQAVAATSASNAWAVGDYVNASNGAILTLIERWNGTAWKQQASPNACTCDNMLTGVAATSTTNAWAVGNSFNGTTEQALIEHWNGRAWKQVPSPNPGGSAGDDNLDAVAATSAANAWAVGGFFENGPKRSALETLVEHWNGRAWKQVPSPNPADSSDNLLIGVTAAAAANAWAVGFAASDTLTEHWNGKRWTRVSSPSPQGPELTAVSAVTASTAWAVGNYGNGIGHKTLAEFWNGHAWTQVKSPNPGGPSLAHQLDGVAATSAANVWAIGDYGDSTAHYSLIEHWNGRTWASVSIPG
jgi:hypothetical protein